MFRHTLKIYQNVLFKPLPKHPSPLGYWFICSTQSLLLHLITILLLTTINISGPEFGSEELGSAALSCVVSKVPEVDLFNSAG